MKQFRFMSLIVLALTMCVSLFTGCHDDEDPVLTLSQYDVSFNSNGGNKSFTVQSNVDWTISCNADWLEMDRNSGTGTQSVLITALPNKESSPKTTVITVRSTDGKLSQSLNVEMVGLNITLSVSATSITFDSKVNDEKHFTINCNAGWKIEDIPEWLDINPAAGENTQGVTLKTIRANESNKPNTATLRITAGDKTENVTVIQESGLSPNCYAVPIDIVSMCSSLVWGYEFGSNVHKVLFDIRRATSFTTKNDADILKDIQDNPSEWIERTPELFMKNGNYFSLYNCASNMEYTLVTVCYDSKGKLGSIDRTNISTKKEDTFSSPYISTSSFGIELDLDSYNNFIYKITTQVDATSAYASNFYTWGIVATQDPASLFDATDAVLAMFLNREINKNPGPHDTYFNGDNRAIYRERLEGPTPTRCEMTIPANIMDDRYIQILTWCRNLNHEFSGILSGGYLDLTEEDDVEESVAKAPFHKAMKRQQGKERMIQFDPKKTFANLKVVRL